MGRGRFISAVLAAALVAGAAMPAAASPTERAMWVWHAPATPVIDFAVSHGVTDIYLHVAPGFSSDPVFAGFLADAHAAGLAVHAMAGDPAWAADADPWIAWVEEVVDHGGFDGIVFDVEPYLHPDWGTNRQTRLIRTFVRGLRDASRQADDLPVLAAVPFWFDEVAYRRTTVLEGVLKHADGIIVMAYRDHANGVDGIIDLASTEAELAADKGRDFVIGVETGDVGLDKITFAEEGEAAMEAELVLVDQAFGSTSGYAGVAIHHYGSYTTLAP